MILNKFIIKIIFNILVYLYIPFNIFAQCSVTSPTTTGDCSFRKSLTLNASGSTGIYNWYNAATGGLPIATGANYQTPVLATTTTYYVSAVDQINTSLAFDGTNDYIALNSSYSAPISQITVEAWVKTTVTGVNIYDNWSILDFDRSDYFDLYVRGNDGEVEFSTASVSGVVDDFYTSGHAVNDGTWHHIAAQYDGTDKVIFVDGVEAARKVNVYSGANIGKTGVTRYGFIGDGSEASTFNGTRNNYYFKGEIDEVRIWNTVRTETEINTNKSACLVGNETGLQLYYKMDETTGTTITDEVGGANGTLYNFDASTAWTFGESNDCMCESSRTPATATIIDDLQDQQLTCSNSSVTIDAEIVSGAESYSWNTGETTHSITTSQSGIYMVTVTGGNCPRSDTASVTGFAGSQKALNFSGSNYAAIRNLSYNNSNYTALTVETWINTTISTDQVIASFDRSEYWRLEINGDGAGAGQVGFDINTSTGVKDYGSTKRVDDGLWHHIAAVFDNGNVKIYIDGIIDFTTTTQSAFGSNAKTTRYGFLGIGSEATTFNGATGPSNYLRSTLDEFRIWNIARTQTQIRQDMAKHISGNTAGLQVYYTFDESSTTNVFDYNTKSQNDALLSAGFGSSPKITSGAPIGDLSNTIFPSTWTGQTLSISSCDGETFTISDMSGTPTGAQLDYVNSVPNNVEGILGLSSNDRYFTIHKTDDPTATYTATYNYTGNPLITSYESTLALFKRADNTSTSWVNANAVLDTTANTLTATAQGTEFILGSTGSALPISLISFDATPKGNNVQITWTTASEINNDFFSLYRSDDGINFYEIGEINGAGNSNNIKNYKFIDESKYDNTVYYKLKQTDFDGKFTYSSIISVNEYNQDFIINNIYTSTEKNLKINLYSNASKNVEIQVINSLGLVVANLSLEVAKGNGVYNIKLPKLARGIYFIKTQSGSNSITSKILF